MSAAMIHLLAAVAVFVGGHFAISSPRARGALVERLGEKRFTDLYSIGAALALVWVVFAYRRAPYLELWPTLAALRLLPTIAMALVVVLLVAGATQYNPTIVMKNLDPGLADPAPGILKVTRHPLMWAFGLWALAHIPLGGDLASLLLFGGFAILALHGTRRIDAKRRAGNPQAYDRLTAVTSNVPFVALIEGRARLSLAEIGWPRLGLAALLYVALFVLHPWIAGPALF